jgi:AspT/YidE/YbjL antiporter-like protein
MGIGQWIVGTLRSYPELAIFLALAVGFLIGPKKLAGFGLGNVTATLLAAVLIGEAGIAVPGPIKSTFFLLFLFAVGYGVGPQSFRGLGKEGPKQIVFSVIALTLCLLAPFVCAKMAGLDMGYAVGLYAGSQTISASIGMASDQIIRLGLPAEQAQAHLDAIPIGYAVTNILGTIGSAIVLAQIGPKLIGVNLAAACADYEQQMGGGQVGQDAGVFSAYRDIEVRAYRIDAASGLTGKPVRELFAGMRIFIERIRRGERLIDADGGTLLEPGDVSGRSLRELADRPVESTDLAVVAAGIVIGGLVGAIRHFAGGLPISLSTSSGALLAGLVLGYLRTIHPTFGNIPGPALWLMNTLGLNVFIAIVGINAGPGFVSGLQQVGMSLFLWGMVATTIPLVVAVLLGHYVFKFHPAILFGVCAGVRTTTAALGMIQEEAKSKVPALG